MAVRVTVENPFDPICAQLIAELSAELAPRYGDDGSGAFAPDDVTVPRSAFVVAWLEDVPAGCGALRPMESPDVCEIKRMFVRPAARGRGVSRHILARLESLAAEFGYTYLRLETGTLQTEAIGLYESSGFRPIPCYGKYAGNPRSLCYEKAVVSRMAD